MQSYNPEQALIEARREFGERGRARDYDPARFQGLAQHFEHVAMKLRQFVQEHDTVMSQGDLARPRVTAATDQRH